MIELGKTESDHIRPLWHAICVIRWDDGPYDPRLAFEALRAIRAVAVGNQGVD
jgi:hypothetical protein